MVRTVFEEDRDALEDEVRREADVAGCEAAGEGAEGLAPDQACQASAHAEVGAAREGNVAGDAAVETEGVGVVEGLLLEWDVAAARDIR